MPVLLRELTTIRLGGPAKRFEAAKDTDHLIELVREADAQGEPVLVMSGGSNLVIGDEGFDGLVVQVATEALSIDGTTVRADAGVGWDLVVSASLDAGLAGLEALSGIPGSAGGTPIQNVGAYGALTSDVLSALTVYDRASGTVERWGPEQCGFGRHRQSVFKRSDRWIVLDVTWTLRRAGASAPVAYQRLADRLGVELGATVDAVQVRDAVLQLRAESGMLLDPGDHDTWSVGSFFLNPIVAEVPAKARDCPSWADPDGIKLPAAWLINHAGFERGYGRDFGSGEVTLSTKHALAITNRGGATTADVMRLAAHIRCRRRGCIRHPAPSRMRSDQLRNRVTPRPSGPVTLRSVAASAFLPAFIYEIGNGAIAPINALTAVSCGASPELAAFMLALPPIGLVLGDIPSSALVTRFGDRRAMTIAAGAACIALFACFLARSLLVLGPALLLGRGGQLHVLPGSAVVPDRCHAGRAAGARDVDHGRGAPGRAVLRPVHRGRSHCPDGLAGGLSAGDGVCRLRGARARARS